MRAALVDILRALPAGFDLLPILLVLHINATFAASFADWLDLRCRWVWYRPAYIQPSRRIRFRCQDIRWWTIWSGLRG